MFQACSNVGFDSSEVDEAGDFLTATYEHTLFPIYIFTENNHFSLCVVAASVDSSKFWVRISISTTSGAGGSRMMRRGGVSL